MHALIPVLRRTVSAAPTSPEKPIQGPRSAREGYLKAMRQIAGSVAVVTTDGRAGRHGATVTAFSSVSADPPTVLVCLRAGSRICEAVEANGVFTLNILPEDADGLARLFSGEFDQVRLDRFEGVALIERDGLAPAIGCALSFACRTLRCDLQDSHVIFIGRASEIIDVNQLPLIYHDGDYCSVRRNAHVGDAENGNPAAGHRPSMSSE